MRHGKHNHILGVKKEHRQALIANLAAALIKYGNIRTTLAKAKALRPFIEKIITLAKHARQTEIPERRLYLYRLAIARVRDESAVKMLFSETIPEFLKRNGGYTRIYKLLPRLGDASKMAIIEFVLADDKGYKKSRKRKKVKSAKVASVEEPVAVQET